MKFLSILGFEFGSGDSSLAVMPAPKIPKPQDDSPNQDQAGIVNCSACGSTNTDPMPVVGYGWLTECADCGFV